MGELSDSLRAAEARQRNHIAEQERRAAEARRAASEFVAEFIELMQQHEVPKIALCQEGRIKGPLIKAIYQYDWEREKKYGRHTSVLGLGWVAIESYGTPTESLGPLPGVIIIENGAAYEIKAPSQESEYVVPYDTRYGKVGSGMPERANKIFEDRSARFDVTGTIMNYHRLSLD